MAKSVRIPGLIAAGVFLCVASAWCAAAIAQPVGINVRVTGPGSDGAYVDMGRLGSISASDGMELETGEDGTVSVGPTGSDAPTSLPLQPGIYSVWVESGEKDAGGNFFGGFTYVYVGKNGTTNVDFDLTGRPPVEPSGERVFEIGQRAKEACNLLTYQHAVNQLTAYVAEIDKAMRDLQAAIDASLRDGATDGIPEPHRTRVAGILLAGGTPKDTAADLANVGNQLPPPNPLAGLQSAYFRLGFLAEQKARYLDYLQKLQPPPPCDKRTSMYQDSTRPIMVGSKGTVGCDAKLRQDVMSTVGGSALGSALGGGGRSFGFGGGGGLGSSRGGRTAAPNSSSSQEPKISPDPVPTEMKRIYSAGDTRMSFGTNFTDKGLWVSANILDAPCQGTFQTVYLQDPVTGEKAGPTDYLVTELYREWKLTVSWTYDRWVNGQHVDHRQGGWQEGGRQMLGSWSVPMNGKGVWSDLGWGTAVAGAKGMGFFFPIPYEAFAKKPLDIVVHITRPDQEPVGTTGFGFETTPMMREAGGAGRAPRLSPKAPSQKAPPERLIKLQF